MQAFEINARPREDVGKGASRRLRRDGKVPGIVYGAKSDVTMITVDQNEIGHQLDNEAFYSHILTLKLGEESEQVVLKDLQRHPFKRYILHIDFQRIDAKEKLTMRVPLHFINETTCPGVKRDGGVISHVMTDLEISCLPKDLPEYIEVDLGNMEMGDTLHLSDLQLPEGVELYALSHGGDDSAPVANVHQPRVEEAPEEEAGAESEEAAQEPAAEDSKPDEA